MGAWGTSIFSDDLAQDIRREYRILLSVGKDNDEVEKMLMEYYSSILNCNDPDEDVFWFALALCEWKNGRLSPFVKEKALLAIEMGWDLDRWKIKGNQKNYEKRLKVLEEFKKVILSPLPPVKKIRKPTVHHCPWKVGSLLAYRIISNEDRLKEHPCFGKYVLLRVIRIDKIPVSRLFETEYYDESMFVGLYDWIGNEIPDPQIVNKLNYIPIRKEDYSNQIDTSTFQNPVPNTIKEILNDLSKKNCVTCVQLQWEFTKGKNSVITCLGCDESYENNIPDFFDFSCHLCPITHFLPFDISLSNIFAQEGTAKDTGGRFSCS